MADGNGSGRFVFAKHTRDTDLMNRPTTMNEKGKPVRYFVGKMFIFQEEVEEIPIIDITIKDNNKIRDVDETQPLKTEDMISIDNNDEAHPVATEDTIIINDNIETENIINTPDNVKMLKTDLRNNHPHQRIGHTQRRPMTRLHPLHRWLVVLTGYLCSKLTTTINIFTHGTVLERPNTMRSCIFTCNV
jgi:hypothetical protein